MGRVVSLLLMAGFALMVLGDSGSPLSSYYNFEAQDNLVTATRAGMLFAESHNYKHVNLQFDGGVASNSSQLAGSTAIYQYYSASLKDSYLTRTNPGGDYTMVRLEGYVYLKSAGPEAVELRQYFSKDRNDHFLCAQGSPEEQSAVAAGYQMARVEAYGVGVPMFEPFVWNSTVPTNRGTPCPFAQSGHFQTVSFEGRYANYGGADTWYPTWAADGNLYTPWTDGAVNGVAAGSGCAAEGCMSTTGFATVIGDNPLALNLTGVGKFASSPSPYHGRYPCGSLYYNKTWFYGTYTLDNENHQPGQNAAGYCENWCIQGPFAGFRWTTDYGESWTEPRVHMGNWSDNIFGEQAPDNHTSKVKFGAPHVVDFGQELEHSPDGKMYIVGHGASKPYSPTSWMQASEVYMARVDPTVEAVSDRSQWEFYSGTGQGDDQWAQGDVTQARPLLNWGNTTGVTTMTFLPAVQKFVMCISTPSFSPFTERQFDTYFLESSSLYGPFSMISYMAEFGPESYFVNIPSKFVAPKADADGSLSMYLSYSANFAFHSDSNPPGSGYHWTLTKIKLSP